MTRKRRYLISAAVLVACVCVALGVLAMLPPRPGVTKANYDRIEKGMTLEEAKLILGDNYEEMGGDAGSLVVFGLAAEHSQALIGIQDGRVVEKTWEGPGESITDKLRRWLRLPK